MHQTRLHMRAQRPVIKTRQIDNIDSHFFPSYALSHYSKSDEI
jgi:hypothetical protein